MNSLTRAVDGADAVINLAGSSIAGSNPLLMRWTKNKKDQIINSRIQAGEKLTAAIQSAQAKPEVLIQASAIGYYGNTGGGIVDESSPAGRDFLAEVSQPWEQSTASVEQLGVRRIIARFGLVFSKQDGIFSLLSLPFKIFFGGVIGSGEQFLSWIHIDDVSSALRFLIMNKNLQGTYNLVSPSPVMHKEFADKISKEMGRAAWFPLPGFLLKIVLGEASTLALDGRQILPKRLSEAGFRYEYNQLEDALPDLLQK
jgi:uncharacterized protein (TIGR01777 family)